MELTRSSTTKDTKDTKYGEASVSCRFAELRPIAEDTTTDAVFAKLEAQGVVTRPTTRLVLSFALAARAVALRRAQHLTAKLMF